MTFYVLFEARIVFLLAVGLGSVAYERLWINWGIITLNNLISRDLAPSSPDWSFSRVFLIFIRRLLVSAIRTKNLFFGNLKKKLYSIPTDFDFRSDISFQSLKLVWVWVPPFFGTPYNYFFQTNSVVLFLRLKPSTVNKVDLNLIYLLYHNWKKYSITLLTVFKTTFGDGFLYLRGLFVIFFIDATITDDEPLWEPVEWSLAQSWIMFIFLFAWIGENLISSRYGSYTGRDKRVWFSWYKTFWLLELWYILSLGLASLWVMVPHYYEITYSVSFIHSWWHWYSRVFFFKFISVYTVVLFLAYHLQISMRWVNWKKPFIIIILINFFLSYLIYAHFFFAFFGYFTDSTWCQKTRLIDYVQLSHEPFKWSWGPASRDHFTYHQSKTVFWFKSDGPFAGAFLFYNMFFFLALFTLLIYWITLVRRVYTTQEVTFTFTTYCISALKQFLYFFSLVFVLVLLSYMFTYWRLPVEFQWGLNPTSWLSNFLSIVKAYPQFLWTLFW